MKKYSLLVLFFPLLFTACTKEFDAVTFPNIGSVTISESNLSSLTFNCIFNGDFDQLNYDLENVGFCYSLTNNTPTIEDEVIPGTIATDGRNFTGTGMNFPLSKSFFVRGFINIGAEIIYSSTYIQAPLLSIGTVQVRKSDIRSLSLRCIVNGDFDQLNHDSVAMGFCYSTSNKFPTIEHEIITGTITQDGRGFNGTDDNLPHSKEIFIRGFINTGQEVIYSPVYKNPPFPAGVISLKNIASFATARTEAVAFSIGTKGYVGTGSEVENNVPLNDFWEYDPTTNAWAQIANFPRGTSSATAFTIDNKGYVAGGGAVASPFGTNAMNYSAVYAPTTNTWKQIADMPKRTTGAIGLSMDNKGYIIGGIMSNDLSTAVMDVQMYDPLLDNWTLKNPAPIPLTAVAGVILDGIAYIGPGYSAPNTFLAYSPKEDTWTFLPQLPGKGGGDFLSFTHKGKIYLGFGSVVPNIMDIQSNIWQYDPSTQEWLNFTKAAESSIAPNFTEAVSFSIGERTFVGTGQNEAGYSNLFFEINFD